LLEGTLSLSPAAGGKVVIGWVSDEHMPKAITRQKQGTSK
jgi:hypothetical protein